MRLIDADALKKHIDKLPALPDGNFAGNHSALKALVNMQPTIKPSPNSSESPNNWIPCSERMPDEHEWLGTKEFGTTISDEVYVTFETPKGERFCKHLNFQNKKLSDYDQHTIDVFYKGSKPIAWMPLPEPYEPKEE